jgi:mannosyl-oligosaccharide alpha-1,2-mannosidase
MMQHAWSGYETYAWGKDELNPVSLSGKLGVMGGMNGFRGMGASLVDAMSTLHMMSLYEEFDHAKEWVSESMSISNATAQQISFFETTIRLLGGLLSAYDLSSDPALLDMAEELGDCIKGVFDGESTGIATNKAQLPMTVASSHGEERVMVAELGSNLIEFGALCARTGREEFCLKAEMGLRFIHAKNPDQFLLGETVSRRTGQTYGKMTIGAGADSYYEYLLKYWILTGKKDEHWRERWVNSVDEALDLLLVEVEMPGVDLWGNVSFIGSGARNSRPDMTVSHLGCFYPGSVALGVMSGAVTGEKAERYLGFAEDMMGACLQLYNTTTGLGAESGRFQGGELRHTGRRYLQRPEVVESLFYLWRATHDQIWRDMAWEIVQAIDTWCRVDGGFAGIQDVMVSNPDQVAFDDVQQSWFLAETLKYLYLIFEDDSKIDIAGHTEDTWVFNTEAHPVRAEPSSQPQAISRATSFFFT